jgi:hypothetical protein
MNRRCFLMYALVPEGTTAREANDRLNEYVADSWRGLWSGTTTWSARTAARSCSTSARRRSGRYSMIPGPLAGWEMAVDPLTFSLSAVGFAAQTSFTLESYRGVSLDDLAAAEPHDPRFWWKRRSQ